MKVERSLGVQSSSIEASSVSSQGGTGSRISLVVYGGLGFVAMLYVFKYLGLFNSFHGNPDLNTPSPSRIKRPQLLPVEKVEITLKIFREKQISASQGLRALSQGEFTPLNEIVRFFYYQKLDELFFKDLKGLSEETQEILQSEREWLQFKLFQGQPLDRSASILALLRNPDKGVQEAAQKVQNGFCQLDAFSEEMFSKENPKDTFGYVALEIHHPDIQGTHRLYHN